MSESAGRAMMTAVAVSRTGGPDVLSVVERARPVPTENEVLIGVAAAGLNHVDLRQRKGINPLDPAHHGVLGLEVAGRVVTAGSNVRRWREDDRVCALLSGGGYAIYACADATLCLPIPPPLDTITAAALPEAFFTVWSSLIDIGGLKSGETLLVHGGSSGIGTTAIQVACLLGARVLTTAGSAEKCRACEALGAERAINYRDEDVAVSVQQATGRRGVDVLLDILGGRSLQRNVDALAPRGRLVSLGFIEGATGEIDLSAVARKRAIVTGGFLRNLSLSDKAALAKTIEARVWPWIEQGRFRPVIDSSFPLTEAAAAHRRMESSAHIGKVLLVTGAGHAR